MSICIDQTSVPFDATDISDCEINERVAAIRSNWGPAERARRKALGRARRESLMDILDLQTHATCA